MIISHFRVYEIVPLLRHCASSAPYRPANEVFHGHQHRQEEEQQFVHLGLVNALSTRTVTLSLSLSRRHVSRQIETHMHRVQVLY